MNANIRRELSRYLSGKGYLNAIDGLLDVYDKLHTLPEAIHDIPRQVRGTREAYGRLVKILERAVAAAQSIEQSLPSSEGLYMDYVIERELVTRLTAVLNDVKRVTPKIGGGRPKSIGEEKITLAVYGVLHRSGVPDSRVFTVAKDCLMLMGFDISDRVVNQVRKLTKPT